MKFKFKQSFQDLLSKLNTGKLDAQDALLDLSYLVSGDKCLKREWQDTIENLMWKRLGHSVPSAEAFVECDEKDYEDGTFLINHDPNYTNYVHEDSFIDNKRSPQPITKHEALGFIKYVGTHLKDVYATMSRMDDVLYQIG